VGLVGIDAQGVGRVRLGEHPFGHGDRAVPDHGAMLELLIGNHYVRFRSGALGVEPSVLPLHP